MEENIAANLQRGFEKCGICTLNKQKLLDRLPNLDVDKNLVGAAFIKSLESKRSEVIDDAPRQKRNKLNVIPGRNICSGDVQPSVSATPKQPTLQKRRIWQLTFDDSSNEQWQQVLWQDSTDRH
ncbi:hypothetical protein PR048_009712 [Dryococelus australis]|uniref:Uncharacterized protein n=1 Tax=Dryococelus australis TaxID=614101 RepID=A0ABQ9I0Q5_9NEOP|nr:hypothetical protein PR048_009712 [Dryococelus australis]